MKKIVSILFLYLTTVFAERATFDLSVVFPQATSETRTNIDDFTRKLKDGLNNFDWEFPHQDFETIENSIYLNIEKEESNYFFKGLLTISSGLKQSGTTKLLQKRDILLKETNISMRISYKDEPDMNNKDINSVENILKFYVYCVLLENFDRLSYTDNENFYLHGEKYVNKLTTLTGRISGPDDIQYWENRKKIADDYQNGKKNEERKLNAFIYNAKYFINAYKPERAKYFVVHIINLLERLPKDTQSTYFNTYYLELAEIFRQESDKSYLEKLKKMDPAHAKQYGK